jgi:type VI secretion system protein ImpM
VTPSVRPAPPAQAPGLYGKVPAQGDFVRSNVVDPAAVEFSRWLEEAQETLYRTGAVLPDLPVCFVYAAGQARNALVGALLPSRDAVGRVFPLSVFVPVDAAALASRFALVPLAFVGFLGEVARLLSESATLSAAELVSRVRALPLPGLQEWDFAEGVAQTLLDQPAGGLLDSVSDGDAGPAYGFRTFLSACSADRTEPPARTRVVLECPLAGEGPAPWLHLASRALAWQRQPPAFLWTEAAPPRLLLSLGVPPVGLLNHLARADSRLSVVWPLRTSQPAAQEAAAQALTAAQRQALASPDWSIARVFAALTA